MTRRPIKTRGAAWVQNLAQRLNSAGVTPNQISIFSMIFAALAFGAFGGASLLDGDSHVARAVCFLLAAFCIQLRLLCNLLDGIVAVEGGQSAPDGPFWNEAPDRLADILILLGLGLAAGSPLMGMTAGAMAVVTAYVRELGRAEGMQADFSGPFAKPQRMAAATLAALLAVVTSAFAPDHTKTVLFAAITVITIGAAATAVLRSRRLIAWMKQAAP